MAFMVGMTSLYQSHGQQAGEHFDQATPQKQTPASESFKGLLSFLSHLLSFLVVSIFSILFTRATHNRSDHWSMPSAWQYSDSMNFVWKHIIFDWQDRIVQHDAMHIREQTTMQKQTRSGKFVPRHQTLMLWDKKCTRNRDKVSIFRRPNATVVWTSSQIHLPTLICNENCNNGLALVDYWQSPWNKARK